MEYRVKFLEGFLHHRICTLLLPLLLGPWLSDLFCTWGTYV